jgi:hypothetical protein
LSKQKYIGTESLFYDDRSPFNDVPTADLERMARQTDLTNQADRFLSRYSADERLHLLKHMADKVTPKAKENEDA